jgi:hypothetical protein
MRNWTGLAVMIITICFLSPTYSGTVRNPKTNMCMDCADREVQQVNCSAGSPSQTWILENRNLKCKASGKCLNVKLREVSQRVCADNSQQAFIRIPESKHGLKHRSSGYCLMLSGQDTEYDISFRLCHYAERNNSQDVYYE